MGGWIETSFVLQRTGRPRVEAERVALLEEIGRHGSISAAAKRVGLSYKAAWDAVMALNNLFDRPLVEARPGGRRGGGAVVTEAGRAVIAAFHKASAELDQFVESLGAQLADPAVDPAKPLLWGLSLRSSARNALRGTVRAIRPGAVNDEVVLSVAEGVELVAVITSESVATLGLEPGVAALALIKSSNVLVMEPGGPRLSARNQLPGTIARRIDGPVSSEIVMNIGGGKTMVAVITRTGADDLAFVAGDPVIAVVKASSIILAVE